MAKVKNTGEQPRGFITAEGNHVIVAPGEEAEFNLSDGDFKYQQELLKDLDPAPYELSGSAGGVKPGKRSEEDKKHDEALKKEKEEELEKLKQREEEARKEGKPSHTVPPKQHDAPPKQHEAPHRK